MRSWDLSVTESAQFGHDHPSDAGELCRTCDKGIVGMHSRFKGMHPRSQPVASMIKVSAIWYTAWARGGGDVRSHTH